MTDRDVRLAAAEVHRPAPDPIDSFRIGALAVALLFIGLGFLALALQVAIRLGWI